MNVYKKWCLEIDDTNLTVPTKEHGIRLGKYLKSFGVPVKFYEISLTAGKKAPSDVMEVVNKTKEDVSSLLDDNTRSY